MGARRELAAGADHAGNLEKASREILPLGGGGERRSRPGGVADQAASEVCSEDSGLYRLVVEVVSPGTERVDTADKLAEYALAGIPWYWIAWVSNNSVESIEVYVLDHVLGQYRPHLKLEPTDSETVIDVPIEIRIDWTRLGVLAR
ncbi:Uma2 family endonuclease [Nocardia sp. R7R-8]|uniref:Uma2 family endonuclease n=1 Tax=Nocardia sp. R7R-8 TaxID=3459304 RepID=UPI00403DDCB9